jgi:hypothetical protein
MGGEKEREFYHCLMTASQNIVQETARKNKLIIKNMGILNWDVDGYILV